MTIVPKPRQYRILFSVLMYLLGTANSNVNKWTDILEDFKFNPSINLKYGAKKIPESKSKVPDWGIKSTLA
jgi:hypothetical protein